MNILIPNATGPINIGDQAILTPLIGLLKTAYPTAHLTIHGSEPGRYQANIVDKLAPTLYAWSVFENRNLFIRFYRVALLVFVFLLEKSGINFIPDPSLGALVSDYKRADLIVFVGGGYLRSQKGLTQTLNLLMLYLQFQFAKLFTARKIIAPMSFGPFAYAWHERLCANGLKDFDLVAVREQFSFNILRRYDIPNLIQSVDTALLLNLTCSRKKLDKPVLGFTIRQWLKPLDQARFETEFSNAIVQFATTTGATVQPIVQVDAPQYGDVDFAITENVANKLLKSKINTLKIKTVTSLESARNIYSRLSLLLGMRMHSNILAALTGTPFVAISYEHKTDGIARDLGLAKYCISVLEAKQSLIYTNLITVFKNKNLLSQQLLRKTKSISTKERQYWQSIFTSID